MSITDDIHETAKKSKESKKNANKDDKILKFTNDYTVVYRAFSAPTKESLLRLEIKAKKMFLMPKYELLYDVAYLPSGDFIGLIYPHMQVKLFGRNMNPIAHALVSNSVEWIMEYLPPHIDFAEDDDIATLPCIEKIIIENTRIDPEAELKARASETDNQTQ